MSTKKRGRPKWLLEFKRRTRLIEIIDLAFSNPCDCEVCTELREVAHELGDLFTTPALRVRRR